MKLTTYPRQWGSPVVSLRDDFLLWGPHNPGLTNSEPVLFCAACGCLSRALQVTKAVGLLHLLLAHLQALQGKEPSGSCHSLQAGEKASPVYYCSLNHWVHRRVNSFLFYLGLFFFFFLEYWHGSHGFYGVRQPRIESFLGHFTRSVNFNILVKFPKLHFPLSVKWGMFILQNWPLGVLWRRTVIINRQHFFHDLHHS